jgi:GMP synthase-like glutamine amidotransferase
MKINIILCDTFPGLLPPFVPSYASMFTTLFDAVSTTNEYRIFPAFARVLPTTFAQNELYVITGSNAGAYQQETWIQELLTWIRQADAEKVKLAGICFGHQAIAQALGGEVVQSPKGWGVGIRKSRLLSQAAHAYFPDREMRLLYNHHDQVVRLPKEAEPLATSEFCRYETFGIGQHILTFQGHPEFTPEYEEYLITNNALDEPEEVKNAALTSLKTDKHQGQIAAKWIIDWVGSDSNNFIGQ